jgi:hypothetical protein
MEIRDEGINKGRKAKKRRKKGIGVCIGEL